jgi:hypothetical protein
LFDTYLVLNVGRQMQTAFTQMVTNIAINVVTTQQAMGQFNTPQK